MKNSIFFKFAINSFIFFLICFHALFNFTTFNKNVNKIELIHMNELIKVFQTQNFNKNFSILTFDGKVQTNLILQGYKNLNMILGINTSLNDEILEKKIIESFRFLKLDVNDFKKFIQNEKHGWRYINSNIGNTFYMKYQANTLTTFKKSMDFSTDEKMFIQKSSPLNSQQLIIPNFEINRLVTKFLSISEINQKKPKIIIINNHDFFSKNVKIDRKLYCHKIINETYEIFYNKELNQCI